MIVSQNGVDLIKQFEGYRDKSYRDSANIWTIGYGSTMWSDGKAVQRGQFISLEQAEKLLAWEVGNKAIALNSLTHKVILTQNQFDALASFTYNLGVGALTGSTLISKVRLNACDETIRNEFLKWSKARVKGVLTFLPGLAKRRSKEADLYFLTPLG